MGTPAYKCNRPRGAHNQQVGGRSDDGSLVLLVQRRGRLRYPPGAGRLARAAERSARGAGYAADETGGTARGPRLGQVERGTMKHSAYTNLAYFATCT